MQIKKSTLKNTGVALGFIIVIGILLLTLQNTSASSTLVPNSDAVSISGDIQTINITAKVGYTPSNIIAKANVETILKISTDKTFDCSADIRFPSLKIDKLLPANGVTEIALGSQPAGSEINGTCSMGMYNVKIKFS